MHLVYRLDIFNFKGERLGFIPVRCVTDDLDFFKQEAYASYQQDYLPELIQIDISFIDVDDRTKKHQEWKEPREVTKSKSCRNNPIIQ